MTKFKKHALRKLGKDAPNPKLKFKKPYLIVADVRFTLRQKLFIKHYVACRNATKAAKLAGYADSSAHVTGSQFINNPKIWAVIERLIEEEISNTALTSELVLRRLKELAISTKRDSVSASCLKMLGDHLGLFEAKPVGNPEDSKTIEETVLETLSRIDGAQ